MQLGQAEIQPYPTPSQAEEGFVYRERVSGPIATPTYTTQSPTPVYYPPTIVQQTGGIPWLPLAMGAAILILVVVFVRG